MTRRQSARVGLAAVCLGLTAAGATAHTTLPATLDITEVAHGIYTVAFRVPIAEGPPAPIFPVLPAHCMPKENPAETSLPDATLTRANIECSEPGLIGSSIDIEGLPMTIMSVVVRIEYANGTSFTKILRPDEPQFIVPEGTRNGSDALGYARMGVGHILSGIDHLLFVAGLLLIVSGVRPLLKAITAFTVAHSLTLALATLGVVSFSPTPVEAVIALSIVFLAVELARHHMGMRGITYTQPWLVAFAFGLLHGLGFAGTLAQVGIPHGAIPMALLSFNVGVEAGQLGFIAVFLTFVASLRTLDIAWPSWTDRIPAYTIGSLASYWFLQRCILTFGL